MRCSLVSVALACIYLEVFGDATAHSEKKVQKQDYTYPLDPSKLSESTPEVQDSPKSPAAKPAVHKSDASSTDIATAHSDPAPPAPAPTVVTPAPTAPPTPAPTPELTAAPEPAPVANTAERQQQLQALMAPTPAPATAPRASVESSMDTYSAPVEAPAATPESSMDTYSAPVEAPAAKPAAEEDAVAPHRMSPKKMAGPIVGALAGAGAIAGVIAISVMKQQTTTPWVAPIIATTTPLGFQPQVTVLTAAVSPGATALDVGIQAGFEIGGDFVIDQGTPFEEVNTVVGYGSLLTKIPIKYAHQPGAHLQTMEHSKAKAFLAKQLPVTAEARVVSAIGGPAAPAAPVAATAAQGTSSMAQQTALIVGGAAVTCILLVAIVACMVYTLGGKKKNKKRQGLQREQLTIPEDQQPLKQLSLQDNHYNLPDMESQYMAVGGMESQYMPVGGPAAGLGGLGLGSMPTMAMGNIPMQTMPPPAQYRPPTTQGFTASPLANTVSALPTNPGWR